MLDINQEKLAELADLFSHQFPERENIQIENFLEIVEGWETKIFSFDLSYNEESESENKAYVIRLFFGSEQNQQAEREFIIMQRVRKTGLLVPRVVYPIIGVSPLLRFLSVSLPVYLVIARVVAGDVLVPLQTIARERSGVPPSA